MFVLFVSMRQTSRSTRVRSSAASDVYKETELRKVAWPTREELTRYSIIVFVAIVALTMFVTALDWVFLKFVQDFLFDSGVDPTPAGAPAGLISAGVTLFTGG